MKTSGVSCIPISDFFWDPLVSDKVSSHRVSSRHGEVEVGGGQRPVARDEDDHQSSSWKVLCIFIGPRFHHCLIRNLR